MSLPFGEQFQRPWTTGRIDPALCDPFFVDVWRDASACVAFEPSTIYTHDHVTGQMTGVTNSPLNIAPANDRYLGPSISVSTTFNSAVNVQVPPQFRVQNTDTEVTMAAIALATSNSGVPGLVHTATSTYQGGVDILQISGRLQLNVNPIGSIDSGLSITTNRPYFMAGSMNRKTGTTFGCAFVIYDLLSQELRSSTSTSTINPAANIMDFCHFGSYNGVSWPGRMAMGFLSNVFFPVERLEEWARINPWGLFDQEEFFEYMYNRPIAAAPPVTGPFGKLYMRDGKLQSLTGGHLAA